MCKVPVCGSIRHVLFICDGAWYRRARVVTKDFDFGKVFVSGRVFGDVRWRMNLADLSQRSERDVTKLVSVGQLILTIHRVIFHGAQRSVTVAHSKILDAELYLDGVEFTRESGTKILILIDENDVRQMADALAALTDD